MTSAPSSPRSVTDFPTLSFLPNERDGRAPDWSSLLAQEMSGIWLIERAYQDALETARGWSIALVTKANRVLVVHPAVDSQDATAMRAVVRPIATVHEAALNKDFQIMIFGSLTHYGRAVQNCTTVADALTTLDDSGIAFYKLKNERGLRFWLALALFVLRPHIKEPNPFDFLQDLSLRYLRRHQILDEDGEKTGIQIGHTYCHKLNKTGWESVLLCLHKNDDTAEWMDI